MIPGLSFVKHSFFVCPSFAREISVDYCFIFPSGINIKQH